jgi:hypothetical protein
LHRLSLALLVWVAPTTLAGQAYRFDPKPIRTGLDSMAIFLVRQGTPAAIGQLWDEIVPAPGSQDHAWRRVYRTQNQVFGPHLDTTVVPLPALTLIGRRTRSALFSDSLVGDNGRIRGWYQQGQKPPTTVTRDLPAGVIESSFYDLAVRAAPLAPGYTLTLSGYTSSQDSVLTLSSTVQGEEEITQRDGQKRATWRVEMTFGGLPSVMWIDKDTRALVKQTIDLGQGNQILMQR